MAKIDCTKEKRVIISYMKDYSLQLFTSNDLLDKPLTQPRVLLRENIINALNHQYSFSDDELYLIACIFPDIIKHVMTPTESVVKAYIKTGGPLQKDTFPQSVWDNDELLFLAACNIRFIPAVIHEKITLEKIKNYVHTHSDAEIAIFCNRYRTGNKNIQKYLKSAKIQKIVGSYSKPDQEELPLQKNNLNCGTDNVLTCKTESVLKKYTTEQLTLLSENIQNVPSRRVLKANELETVLCPGLFHYITDLHITNKIYTLVQQGTDFEEAVFMVTDKATSSIANSLYRWSKKYDSIDTQNLLIGGDVSFDFDIACLFFERLMSKIPNDTVVYTVLGNHELWDGDPEGTRNHQYAQIVKKYRNFFSRFKRIRFLENQLAVIINDKFYEREEYIFDEEELQDPQKQNLIETLIKKSQYLVFGSIGFAGNNNVFNASNGIYRATVSTIKYEKELSSKCEKTYKRCLELSKGKDFICLTHMPFSDWSKLSYASNCFYVNGHTHNNVYENTDVHLFADNQIGYMNNKFYLKQFVLDTTIDYFANFPDGIHLISNYDYYEFLRLYGLSCTFRPGENVEVYLLKKDFIYMFISKSKTGLCILNGGSKKKLNSKDINYYYENLDVFADAIRTSFSGYNDALKRISKTVKSLGGDGKIHGSIIDIDFFNHVYLNPFDGKITFYYATDICSRVSYDSLLGLIEHNPSESPVVERMHRRLIDSKKNTDEKLIANTGTISFGTTIYKSSRVMNKVQKLFNYNVLQIWDESILDHYRNGNDKIIENLSAIKKK